TRPLDSSQFGFFQILRAQKIRAHRTGAEDFCAEHLTFRPSCDSSSLLTRLRSARLGWNHFNLPASVIEALDGSFAHSLGTYSAYIQHRFRFIEFLRAGIERRSSRHEDRATI